MLQLDGMAGFAHRDFDRCAAAVVEPQFEALLAGRQAQRRVARAARTPQRQRPEALRRLGDLEMDHADRRAAESSTAAGEVPDYRAAITRYQELLQAYPQDPRNDRVRYQLARAVKMRHVPELHFHYDESMDRGERIDNLLRDLRTSDDDSE